MAACRGIVVVGRLLAFDAGFPEIAGGGVAIVLHLFKNGIEDVAERAFLACGQRGGLDVIAVLAPEGFSSVSPWLIRSLMASLRVWRSPADFALSWCLRIALTVRGLGVKDIFMVKPHFVV